LKSGEHPFSPIPSLPNHQHIQSEQQEEEVEKESVGIGAKVEEKTEDTLVFRNHHL
jgi:hypothetical protein